jgi:hypothetical protein
MLLLVIRVRFVGVALRHQFGFLSLPVDDCTVATGHRHVSYCVFEVEPLVVAYWMMRAFTSYDRPSGEELEPIQMSRTFNLTIVQVHHQS